MAKYKRQIANEKTVREAVDNIASAGLSFLIYKLSKHSGYEFDQSLTIPIMVITKTIIARIRNRLKHTT